MIDTHCHLNFKAYQNDWREVADRAVETGVTKMIVVGTDLVTSKRAVEMAQQHQALYAAVGVHPHHARQITDYGLRITEIIAEVAELAKQPKVVAIGEVGLDNHGYKVTRYQTPVTSSNREQLNEIQKQLFVEQVKVARELNKPLILHSREAKEEVLEILQKITSGEIRGVFHCFGGSKGFAKRILEAGLYLGFDGDITYVPDRLGVATTVPLERLLLETDAPYLTPVPYRGERNEPRNIKLIAEAHARIRGVTAEKIAKTTTENAENLFRLD